MDFAKHLNEKQLEAVETASQYVRIVAGAGSGKTRVLTYRLSYLIEELGVEPWRILAIAFTNKAAKEMKTRTESLVPSAVGNLKIMTFHAFCARFLREEAHNIAYPSYFTIYDEDDQKRLVKAIAVNHGYPKRDAIIGQTLDFIGHYKTLGLYPSDVDKKDYAFHPMGKECYELWVAYEKALASADALDFDDLLAKTNLILREFPEVKDKWSKRFDHILIDEFQDTNDVQYELVNHLLRPSTCLYVVGDPDQTIYTWRGANQDILIQMEKKYRGVETIILNQNYRSTQNILNAANKLISHNHNRIKKDLFTKADDGVRIVQYNAINDDDEAKWICNQIIGLKVKDKDFSYTDVAVLYRSAYLTRSLERALVNYRIPYVVYGGIRFYSRQEVKDVLAYWRLILNQKDDISFERIVNVPRRGIGDKTFETLRDEAKANEYSLYEYLLYLDDDKPSELRRSVRATLRELVLLMESYRKRIEAGLEALSEVLREYVKEVGYFEYLSDDEENGEERAENVHQLIQDVYNAVKQGEFTTFEEYMQNITLYTMQDEIKSGDYVTLMTVHVAKGLEYPNVFVLGLNDGVFPNNRSVMEGGSIALEEERRLAYVAFTRAEHRLFLSCSNEYSYILDGRKVPSMFFKEADLAFPETDKRFEFGGTKAPKLPTGEPLPPKERATKIMWKVGDIANHKVFGRGIVQKIIDETILEIKFDQYGIKKIMAQHPSVERVVREGDLS